MGGLFSRRPPATPAPTPAPTPAAVPRNTGQSISRSQTNAGQGQPKVLADNEHYVQELSDIGEFLNNLETMITEQETTTVREALGLDRDAMSSYIEALNMKANQLSGIRLFINKHRNSNDLKLLSDLLDDVEPKCVQMRNRFSASRDMYTTNYPKNQSRQIQTSPVSTTRPSSNEQPTTSAASAQSSSDFNRSVSLHQSSSIGSGDSYPSTSSASASLQPYASASLQPGASGEPSGNMTLAGAGIQTIKDWQTAHCVDDPIQLEIDRSKNILDVAIVKYESMEGPTLQRVTAVKFLNEGGVDMGALTTEFFFTTLETVVHGNFKGQRVMEGERGHLIPSSMHDPRLFIYLGRIITHAVINNCRGLPGLSPAITHYLLSGMDVAKLEEIGLPLSMDDVADSDLRKLLRKYDNGQKFDESEEKLWMEWMSESRCKANWMSKDARHVVIQELLIYYVFTKRLRQIKSLEHGLNSVGLRQFLINNRSDENLAFVFPTTKETEYSYERVMGVVITRGDGFDPHTLDMFNQLVQELDEQGISGFRLCDLIQFVTSSRYFPERIVVSFSPDIGIPEAHACYNEVVLPLMHGTYPKFKDSFVTALKNGLEGFQMD